MEEMMRKILGSFEVAFKELGAETSIERNTYVKVMAKNGKDYAWVSPYGNDKILVQFFKVFDFGDNSMTRMNEDMFRLEEPNAEGLRKALKEVNEKLNW